LQNSFEVDFSKLSLSSEEESKLIKLPFDRSLKSKLETVGLAEFWLHISNDYTVLSERAINVLLPFTMTYLSKSRFSAMTAIKTNYRKSLCVRLFATLFVANITMHR